MTDSERARKIAEVRKNVDGLRAAVIAADPHDDEAWADISRRFGAGQRRSRLLAGLGRGG